MFTTPLRTPSPARRSRRRASPVSAGSSSTATPCSRPSTGTTSPAPTSSRSPTTTSSTVTTTTPPGVRRRAALGARSTSSDSSRSARLLARASSSCPLASISAIMAPASGSCTTSAPTRASRAMTSTLGRRRRTATAVRQVDSASPRHVATIHSTSANRRPSATQAAPPATMSIVVMARNNCSTCARAWTTRPMAPAGPPGCQGPGTLASPAYTDFDTAGPTSGTVRAEATAGSPWDR